MTPLPNGFWAYTTRRQGGSRESPPPHAVWVMADHGWAGCPCDPRHCGRSRLAEHLVPRPDPAAHPESDVVGGLLDLHHCSGLSLHQEHDHVAARDAPGGPADVGAGDHELRLRIGLRLHDSPPDVRHVPHPQPGLRHRGGNLAPHRRPMDDCHGHLDPDQHRAGHGIRARINA